MNTIIAITILILFLVAATYIIRSELKARSQGLKLTGELCALIREHGTKSEEVRRFVLAHRNISVLGRSRRAKFIDVALAVVALFEHGDKLFQRIEEDEIVE